MSVDILMATYNGGKYLRNQLLSLQQQTYSDWVLWVRDDGSSDETLAILDEFSRCDARIKISVAESGSRLGAGANFLGLLQCTKADYVAFCDQDDIWFEKKLEILVAHAEENFREDYPSLVVCDGYGYSDTGGVITSDRVWLWYAKNMSEFLFFNSGYQGCCMLFNAKLAKMAASYTANYFYMHDDVVSLLAHAFGRVDFIKKQLMLYRQHDRNVTGNITTRLLPRIRLFFRRDAYVLSCRHFKERKAFFEAYGSHLRVEDVKLFAAYLRFPYVSLVGRFYILLRHNFSIGGQRLPLYLKTLVRRPLE